MNYNKAWGENMSKSIDLSCLPKKRNGYINWNNSVGKSVKFKYDSLEGEIKILQKIDYKLIVQYLDDRPYQISIQNLRNCKLKGLLKEHLIDYKFNIGEEIKPNIIILDKKYEKGKGVMYKIKCKQCGFNSREYRYRGELRKEYWAYQTNLLKIERGCPCCRGSIIVRGINDLATTDPWIMEYLVDMEDGYKYSRGSNITLKVKCKYCKRVHKEALCSIINRHSIACQCSDSIPIPEKLFIYILSNLNIDYIYQLTKKHLEWCGDKRYDFYFKLNDKEYIIETHGKQHKSTKNFTPMKFQGRILDTSDNDLYKKELALNNGIEKDNYIEIDCSESNLDKLINEVKDNKIINKLFDLSNIDWEQCLDFIVSNEYYKIWEYWNNKKDWETTKDLLDKFNFNQSTLSTILNFGNKHGKCNYNSKEEMRKNLYMNMRPRFFVKLTNDNGEVFYCSVNEASKLLEAKERTIESYAYYECRKNGFRIQKAKNPLFIIVSGISSSGKDTIVKKVLENSNIYTLISDTTRPKREGENDGIEYNFIDYKDFLTKQYVEKRIYKTIQGEWAYGISEEECKNKMQNNNNIICILDYEGMRAFKYFIKNENSLFSYYDIKTVFIDCNEILCKNRYLNRQPNENKEELEKEMNRRIESDRINISKYKNEYDYILKNETMEDLERNIKIIKSLCD